MDNKCEMEMERGTPLPLGATIKRHGINFAVFSKHATDVILLIYNEDGSGPVMQYRFNPCFNRTGEVWHGFIPGLSPGICYGYKMDRDGKEERHLHRFNKDIVLIDPYAKAISGGSSWGLSPESDGEYEHRQFLSKVIDEEFDWGFDRPLNIPLADSIIYEVHVRGFTRHSSSNVQHPGTYEGLIEKIPYLKELGVTAVELLPVTEFNELENPRKNPETGERLLNYWGYDPINYFSPKASYSAYNENGGQVVAFKKMVKALHDAGIEVILDVVFNHTAEGDENGHTLSFRGIDNITYYIIDPETGEYHNYSGCGNTINCNHPVVRNMILDCLRYWVTEMHVDGFRFDLASILGRGRDGSVLANPPLLERIAADPVLANTKLIAEAWDAAGLYQVGTFPNWGRWAEWNGKFRDDVRRFIRGDTGMVSALATRIAGSSDLYQHSGRAPYHSINFITSHDGFTLADLVTFNEKHNKANGEDNRDGMDDNLSWNCEVEGGTDDKNINKLRMRQMKNFASILLISSGVPMILHGDALGRTQGGNNNVYCQDNKTSWVNWELVEKNADLLRFFRLFIMFRKRHPVLRRDMFDEQDGPQTIVWHGVKCYHPDWSETSRSLAFQLNGGETDDDIYVIVNAYWEKLKFELPRTHNESRWHRFVDTALKPPRDITKPGKEVVLNNQNKYNVEPRSVVVLVAKRVKIEKE